MPLNDTGLDKEQTELHISLLEAKCQGPVDWWEQVLCTVLRKMQ